VPEDPQVTTGPDPGLRRREPAAAPPAAAPPAIAPTAAIAATAAAPTGRAPLRVSLDLDEITGQILDATVPGFADAAAVFALEQLMASGERGRPDGEVVVRRLGIRFADGQIPGTDVIFPAGEVVAFGPGTPCGGCVTTGHAAVFAEPDGKTAERVASRPGGREILSRCSSFLAAPLTSPGGPTGLLTFARTAVTGAFSDDDAATAASLAARVCDGIADACLFQRHQRTAEALQRGLLTGDPVVPANIEVAPRCLPASGQMIGGDWFDIIPLPDGRTGVVVGDAMGHGPEAAAVMAQLRAAAHALADLDLAPAEVLRRLERTAATLNNAAFATIATCLYAVIDPAAGCATVAAAGHPPPVVALPDGTTRVPDLPPGLPLGLGADVFGQVHLPVPPGAVLALFTDGLVETRTQTADDGLPALRRALAGPRGPLPAMCDAVLAALAGHGEDDTTLVLARIPPSKTPRTPPSVQL
jgi:Stage II sporulation protein E (SpoIIE)